MQQLFNYCPCFRKPVREYRTVFVGNKTPPEYDGTTDADHKFPSNVIISSRYTLWNFVPKNLFEQFHRIANLYFLIMAIIEFTIDSPVPPWTSLFPLGVVIGTTAIKQGYEDWQRHKADNDVNNQEAFVVRDGVVEKVRSMDIQVGDIIKVSENSSIPCDMLLLSSANDDGQCYITSVNLDGETNLKLFHSVSKTKHLQTPVILDSLRGFVECHEPTTDLYQFIGRINLASNGEDFETIPLGPENVLLRGVSLKNTPFVYGCAIYTGQQTKISLNSRDSRHKYSTAERKMNRLLLLLIVLLIMYAVVWTALTVSFYYQPIHETVNMWYIDHPIHHYRFVDDGEKASIVIQLFLGFVVICKNVIPISMYVSIEMQKFIGAKFFDWDLMMYNVVTDEPAKARTSDLNEELGQVQYLFTDKTGTLTKNEMQFRMCSCNGSIYVESDGVLRDSVHSTVGTTEVVTLLVSLALCHTVQVHNANAENVPRPSRLLEYHSASPDEKALVEACQRLGVTYCGCRNDTMELVLRGGQRKSFHRRHVLDFDATRRRMSVVVEDCSDGSLWLICKGAESAIFERAVADDNVAVVERHIEEFARLGLRTLVIARRQLTRDEYDSMNEMLAAAKTTLVRRDEELARVYDVIESGLSVIGATAVEDKLQDGVPDTLTALRQAGIQVWVLTGDRVETAVNVSFSAGHFAPGSKPTCITQQTSSDDCGRTLLNVNAQFSEAAAGGRQESRNTLVIDGRSLQFALEGHRDLLRSVCQNSAAVLCCRLSPIQKAQVVKLMKESRDMPTTAAIGDGANDVSMILEAHVGLGLPLRVFNNHCRNNLPFINSLFRIFICSNIVSCHSRRLTLPLISLSTLFNFNSLYMYVAIYGKEGRHAARASDYAFSQFSYLKRALLVHGFYYYVRLANVIQYFFYKNIALVLSQMFFTLFNGYSAQTLYDGFYLALFNAMFTGLPIIVYGVTERTVTARHLLHHPEYYKTIRKNALLSNWDFFYWAFLGLWHTVVMFFGSYLAVNPGNSLFVHGKGIGVYDFGSIIMTVCILVINFKLILVTYSHNVLFAGSIVFTIGAYFVVSLIYNAIIWKLWPSNLYQSLTMVLSTPSVWLLIVLLVVASLIPDMIIRVVTDTTSPLYQRQRKARTRRGKNKQMRARDCSTAVAFSRYHVTGLLNGLSEPNNSQQSPST